MPQQDAGLVVGRKDNIGERRSAMSAVETSVTADIEEFVREIGSLPPQYVDVEPFGEAEPGGCFRNVSGVATRHGGRALYGWAIWERPRLFATGEFHALRERPDGVLVDMTPKADGERSILFSVDARYRSSFDWLKRPGNLRYRIYRPEPTDIAGIPRGMGGAGRSYNRNLAAKAGVSLDEGIGSNMPIR